MTIDIRKLTTAPESATSSVTITPSASVPPPRRLRGSAAAGSAGPPPRYSTVSGFGRPLGFRLGAVGHQERLRHGGLERLAADDALTEHDERAGAVDQARGVDDRRGQRAGGRPGVEVDVDRVAELVERVLDGLRSGLSGAVRRADGEGARLSEQLERDPVVGHPQRHRTTGVAEVPGERRPGGQHDGEATGPERVRELRHGVGHRSASASSVDRSARGPAAARCARGPWRRAAPAPRKAGTRRPRCRRRCPWA